MDNTLIAYKSLGGNCDRVIKKLGIGGFKIDGDNIYDFDKNSKFYLLIPTYEEEWIGDAWDFMDDYHENCLGIIGSGNFNFGDDMFIFTANDMSKKYDIPVIYSIENFGNKKDINNIKELLQIN